MTAALHILMLWLLELGLICIASRILLMLILIALLNNLPTLAHCGVGPDYLNPKNEPILDMVTPSSFSFIDVILNLRLINTSLKIATLMLVSLGF